MKYEILAKIALAILGLATVSFLSCADLPPLEFKGEYSSSVFSSSALPSSSSSSGLIIDTLIRMAEN